jgi:hypothetical protein
MHDTHSPPGNWQGAVLASRGRQGTPLGRIVFGVFLGLFLWTIVMGVIAAVLLITLGDKISDAIDDAGLNSSLSQPCKASLDAGGVGTERPCTSDDATAIVRSLAQRATT